MDGNTDLESEVSDYGTNVLLDTDLATAVSSWLLMLPAMADANQPLMVAFGWCPMSLLLTRLGVQTGHC